MSATAAARARAICCTRPGEKPVAARKRRSTLREDSAGRPPRSTSSTTGSRTTTPARTSRSTSPSTSATAGVAQRQPSSPEPPPRNRRQRDPAVEQPTGGDHPQRGAHRHLHADERRARGDRRGGGAGLGPGHLDVRHAVLLPEDQAPRTSSHQSSRPDGPSTAASPGAASASAVAAPSIGSTPNDRYGAPAGQPPRLRHTRNDVGAPGSLPQRSASTSSPSWTSTASLTTTAQTAVPSSGPRRSSGKPPPSGHLVRVTAPT